MTQQQHVGDQMANKQNVAQLYKEVKNFFENNKVDTLTATLETVKQKLTENEKYVLTPEQYSMLGFITYLVGLDMTNAKTNIPVKIGFNYRKRMEDNGIADEKLLALLIDILRIIKSENFITTKDDIKKLLERNLKGGKNELGQLRIDLRTAFKHYAIPIPFVKEVSDVMTKTELSYLDLLRMNTLLHKDVVFMDGSMKSTLRLLRNKTYAENMQIGENYYFQQKYAIVHFDSIMSAMELVAVNEKCLLFATLNLSADATEEDRNAQYKEYGFIPESEVKVPEVAPEAKTENEPEASAEEAPKRLPEEDPDYFVRAVLEEYLGRKIENTEDFVEAYKKIVESNEEFLGYFYQYLAVNRNKTEKRVAFETIWPEFSKDELHKVLSERYNELTEAGKEILETVYAPIPANNINHIVRYLAECIDALLISDGKDNPKSYLISQFAENNVTTFEQLRQILSLVETQYISGLDYNAYMNLHNYIKSQTDAMEIFEQQKQIEPMNLELNTVAQIKSFFGMDENQPEVPETVQKQ